MFRHVLTTLTLGVLGAVAGAQGVGSQLLAEVEIEDLSQTGARSFEDLYGRALLLEFFAFW